MIVRSAHSCTGSGFIKLLLGAFVMLYSGYSVADTDTTIRIVLSKSGPIYDRFATTLSNNIHMVSPETPVEVRVLGSMNLEQDLKSPPSLYIPVGITATREIIALKSGVKMMAALVPADSFRILKSTGSEKCAAGSTCSAIVLDQPVYRQLRLVKGIFGSKVRTGVLLNPSAKKLADRLDAHSKKEKLNLYVDKVNHEQDIVNMLEQLLKRVDVVLAAPDPVIYNPGTVKHILLTTYRYKKPLVAFSPGYVKAGAIAAIYSSPEDVANDLGKWVNASWSVFATLPVTPLQPQSYSIELNEWVAKSLNVDMPDMYVLRQVIDGGGGR